MFGGYCQNRRLNCIHTFYMQVGYLSVYNSVTLVQLSLFCVCLQHCGNDALYSTPSPFVCLSHTHPLSLFLSLLVFASLSLSHSQTLSHSPARPLSFSLSLCRWPQARDMLHSATGPLAAVVSPHQVGLEVVLNLHLLRDGEDGNVNLSDHLRIEMLMQIGM